MRNPQQLQSIKTQIMDIVMDMEAEAFEARKKSAAHRHLRARRGIEKHLESKRLARQLDGIDPSIANEH